MYKLGMHLLIYYEDVDQLHRLARASDLRVVRTGPVCCEPRHRRVRGRCLSACVNAEGGHFEHYL